MSTHHLINADITANLHLTSIGRQAARSLRAQERGCSWHAKHRSGKLLDQITAAANEWTGPERLWIFDNIRLIRTSQKEARGLARSLRHHPTVIDESRTPLPRPYALAREYLLASEWRFTEEGIAAFLRGYGEIEDLEMGEIWALKPTLQFVLLERLAVAPPDAWRDLVTSLRDIGEAQWKELFESVNVVDSVLVRDPAGAYTEMDYESRDGYRKVIAEVAKHSDRTEREIAETAVELAAEGRKFSNGSRAGERRSHAGYFLVDQGLSRLRSAVGHNRPFMQRLRDTILQSPNGFYLIGIELMTFVIAYGLLSGLGGFTPIVAGFFLLLLPATQAACDFINNLASFFVPPRALPKLDFSKGIPADCATIVAVPSLLINEAQVRDLVLDLEIRFLANRDRNLYFALLTDSPDADQEVREQDPLVETCVKLIEDLNRRYGPGEHGPFYLFHRHRIFNSSEGRWMGWERKRGKLVDFNQFMRGGFDSFPVKVGDLSVLRRIRYVITVDSDTQLPRDSAAKLIGTIAHPLNRAVVDPITRMVVEGYGILQPRIGISIQSAARSRLASIYSGQTGFDIYTRAVSDVYQDLFAEGIFTGKGIYEIDALREALEHRFPENALLSHDLIEGAYARAGLVSDIELIDDYPSHFSAYSRRKHRWVRGDWQILRWLLPRVPDASGSSIANPISLISRWKILDNLRRSLFEPATLALLVAGWLYLPGDPWYWTAASVAMLLMPAYSSLLFSILRAPLTGGSRALGAWASDTAEAFLNGHVHALLGIVFLLHQALLSADAIWRSMARVFITKRRLLEWETAAEAEAASRRKATVDKYLEWTPGLALIIGALVWLVRPAALPVATPILAAWILSRGISAWLNHAPRVGRRDLSVKDRRFLEEHARQICGFFEDWSSPENHWLIPDNVREDGTAALRLSPTNLGFLLNARVAAVHLGVLSLTDFASRTRKTLESLLAFPKFRGHLMNWYDIRSLAPLEPQFVSTVDSGNLVACLWTLKQAALEFAAESSGRPDAGPEIAADLNGIAETCDSLVRDMDFSFLYHARKKVLSVGYDVNAGRLEPSSYDLLASESRIASFVAIAKGDIPQEGWFHLGRGHTLVGRERVLLSWTGTMFEYLMPALWMRHYPQTVTQQSLEAVVRVQRRLGRRKRLPWGISECACSSGSECDYGYAAFGIPELAMKRTEKQASVVSPYSTFLALSADPRAAMQNLHRMAKLGWSGSYGFYEAADFTRDGGGEIIRSWMAHHQGMSLLAICNLLFSNPFQRYFHAEPQVLATELLLHERLPKSIPVEADKDFKLPEIAAAAAEA